MKPIFSAPFAAVQAAASDARGRKSILYMPAGRWQITPWIGGTPQPLDVLVEPAAAREIEQQRAVQAQGGARAYFSPSHQSSQPWFEVEGFEWATRADKTGQTHTGIWASGSFTEAGARGMAANVFPYFSPEFFVDSLDGKPARVVANPNARLNMGGFVDNPAFPMPPVPVQAAAGENSAPVAAGAVADSNQPQQTNQTDMKKSWLLLDPTPAAGGGGSAAATPVQAAATPPAAAATPAAPAAAAPSAVQAAEAAELAALRAEKTARIEREAEAAVAVMAANGHIAPHDEAAKKQWRADFIANPALIERATKLPKALPQGQIIQAAGGQVLVVSEDIKRVIQAYGATPDATQRGQLWAADLRKRFKDEFDRVVQAANSLGTLTGDLVVQQSLDNLLYKFPMLARVSTDFSGENASFNQGIVTRTRSTRTAQDYNTTTGYANQDKTDTNVTVTINAHKYDQVGFNANELASTRRQLFAEEEEGMFYSLGLAMVDALYALITTGNFTNTPVTKSALDFGRDSVVDMKTTLHTAKVYGGVRTLLLNSTYHGVLEKDTTVISNLSNPNAGQVFSRGVLPEIAGFTPFEAGNLPTTGNLTGFGFRADALCIASRIPNDYATALAGVPATGVMQVITQPETGLSVLVTKYVDHDLGQAKMRAAVMYGVAKGQALSGVILRSAA